MGRRVKSSPVKDRKVNGGEEAGWLIRKNRNFFKARPAPEDPYVNLMVRSDKGGIILHVKDSVPMAKVKAVFSEKKDVPVRNVLLCGPDGFIDDEATVASLGFEKRCAIDVLLQEPLDKEPEEAVGEDDEDDEE